MIPLAVMSVKISKSLLSLIGRGGSMPGSIGLKIDPNILNRLKFDGPVILVTGTNGKTTTANLITSLLEKSGRKVISNRKGDNMKAGITTTLLSNASLSGRILADAVVLEVDERATRS